MEEDNVVLVDRLKPPSIDTIGMSEQRIKADAEKALAFMKRFGVVDLHKVLGLTPYLESENNAD